MNNNYNYKYIRNFCILAHIDHGKSTLANKLINFCKKNNNFSKVIDSIGIEKYKNITIKAKYISLNYKYNNNNIYKFNLVDTPGHDYFSYEVNKSLLICNGALLVIDINKGIQSQTITNYYKLINNNIKIIIVINKIDLNYKKINYFIKKISDEFKINKKDIVCCSSKYNIGIKNLINKIIEKIPFPVVNDFINLKAIIIDIWIDKYLGIFILVYIKDGIVNNFDYIKILNSDLIIKIKKIGILNPNLFELNCLKYGDIGWINISIKYIKNIKIGLILVNKNYKDTNNIDKNNIFLENILFYVNIFPKNYNDYEKLYKILFKLSIIDFVSIHKDVFYNIIGKGIKCGFTGILHFEFIKDKLINEYKLSFITINSNIKYKIIYTNKEISSSNILDFDRNSKIKEIQEIFVIFCIKVSNIYINDIIKFCNKNKIYNIKIEYLENIDVKIKFEISLYKVINGFVDKIKSITKGYSVIKYKLLCFKKSNLFFLDVLINGIKINFLSTIIHVDDVFTVGNDLINKLISIIGRKQIDIKIQILVNKKVVLKHLIKKYRKNVIKKCSGGDINRKIKLLNKQKKGKKNKKLNSKLKLNHLIKSIISKKNI